MKAISPVRSVRSCYEAVCCLSDQSLAIARGSNNKSPALEEPMNLLYDMNDCYSKLRELVPGIPQGTKMTQVEILQHVIDYIFDLQIVLEEEAKGRDPSSEATLLSLKQTRSECRFLIRYQPEVNSSFLCGASLSADLPLMCRRSDRALSVPVSPPRRRHPAARRCGPAPRGPGGPPQAPGGGESGSAARLPPSSGSSAPPRLRFYLSRSCRLRCLRDGGAARRLPHPSAEF
ncbi:DNA-binding protein inhibitor ID-3 isoform X1 [Apteryx mantelli]|uniref:DNA-binding protein inhibitor ID-3 isoform X1 n=1 Tax=Apteryx mantelli TaxID=2696672 RepID=A0ABM4FRC4_9AVES